MDCGMDYGLDWIMDWAGTFSYLRNTNSVLVPQPVYNALILEYIWAYNSVWYGQYELTAALQTYLCKFLANFGYAVSTTRQVALMMKRRTLACTSYISAQGTNEIIFLID